MTFAQSIIVYVVCWWLLLFMALPFGVRPQENLRPGMEHAAPEKTHLKVKFAVVTVLSGFVTWGIDFVIQSGIVAVH